MSVCDSPIFAICTLYLMGNYAIGPVEPLDLTLLSINPWGELVTKRCHNVLIPIWPWTNYACDILKTISVHDSS